MQRILITIFALVAILGDNDAYSQLGQCIDERYGEVAVFDSSDVMVAENVVYGNSTHFVTGANVELKMDIYYPNPDVDPVENRPVVLLLHGGSWMAGNKSAMAYQCMELARRGYVAATASYRLGWDCAGADFLGICAFCGGLQANLRKAMYSAVQDSRAGIRFLMDESTTYGIDEDWLFIGGESAGSITTLHAAYWEQEDADAFIPGFSATAGGLDESGNTLDNDYQVRGILNTCGGVTNLAIIQDTPLPMISFHDDLDCVVPYGCGPVIGCCSSAFFSVCGSSTMHNWLVQNGHCSSLNTVFLSAGHCSFPPSQRVPKSACFMKRIMCGVCTSGATTNVYEAVYCSNLASEGVGPTGCTYPSASNYDPLALIDDGTCEFEPCPLQGCDGDLNGDALINVTDLLIFLGLFGSAC